MTLSRREFAETFAAAPLAFLSETQLKDLQSEDSVAFVLTIDGKTYGLAFRLDGITNTRRAFEFLMQSARDEFMKQVTFKQII